MTEILRLVGYYVGIVVTDIAIGLWEERKMRREMRDYVNENGGQVTAHIVTEETAGPVSVVGGTGHDAKPGDVLVATDRPDVFHVAGTEALEGYTDTALEGYTDTSDADSDDQDDQDDQGDSE